MWSRSLVQEQGALLTACALTFVRCCSIASSASSFLQDDASHLYLRSVSGVVVIELWISHLSVCLPVYLGTLEQFSYDEMKGGTNRCALCNPMSLSCLYVYGFDDSYHAYLLELVGVNMILGGNSEQSTCLLSKLILVTLEFVVFVWAWLQMCFSVYACMVRQN